MRMAKMCLAFFMVVAGLTSGCGVLSISGPQCSFGNDRERCLPDPATVDASNGNDSSVTGSDSKVSGSDVDSSPETAVEIDTGPTVEEVCKDYMFLQDTKWVCHYGFDEESVLGVAVDANHTTCLVYGKPGQWQVKAKGLVFHTPDQLVYDSDKYGVPPSQDFGPKTCDRVK